MRTAKLSRRATRETADTPPSTHSFKIIINKSDLERWRYPRFFKDTPGSVASLVRQYAEAKLEFAKVSVAAAREQAEFFKTHRPPIAPDVLEAADDVRLSKLNRAQHAVDRLERVFGLLVFAKHASPQEKAKLDEIMSCFEAF